MDITQYVSFVLFLAAGLLAALAPPLFRPMIPDVTGWRVAAYILGAIVLFRLLAAPYWLWREEKERADELQAQLFRLDGSDDRGRRAKIALEQFVRSKIDPVYALAVAAALTINDKKDWSGYPSGKVSVEQELRHKATRSPSSLVGRSANITESQERFVDLLNEYADIAANIHAAPMMGCPPLVDFKEYIAWRDADQPMVEAVQHLVHGGDYEIISEDIPHDWGNAPRNLWPKV